MGTLKSHSLSSVNPATPDETLAVSQFGKEYFPFSKEIEGLPRGVYKNSTLCEVSPKIDTARAEKNPFRTETI